MAMGVVDTLMVGRLGAEAIGTVALGSAFFYSFALFALGLLLGLDTMIAQAFGAGDIKACHRALRQGLYLALITTPPVMFACWLVPYFLPSWGINPSVAKNVGPFLNSLSWGTLPLLVYAALRRYLQATGHVKPVTFALVTANIVNLLFNWVFIYGKFGFRVMGTEGAGWSTALARVYMAALLGFFVWYFDRKKGAGLFHEFPRFEKPLFERLVRLGFPAATQITMEVGAFSLATVFAGRLPAAQLAAHQIALNWASVTYMVPLGISSAAAVRVGHAVGRAEYDVARRAGWIAVALGVAFMFCAAIVFIAAPRMLLRAYSPDARVVEAGVPLLALAALFQMFDAIQVVTTGALRGLGDTRTAMFANFAGYWIFGLPLGYFLCFIANWGLLGLWWGLSLALIGIAVVLLFAWARESQEQPGRLLVRR
jgi:MATE family multidrug resistance protein